MTPKWRRSLMRSKAAMEKSQAHVYFDGRLWPDIKSIIAHAHRQTGIAKSTLMARWKHTPATMAELARPKAQGEIAPGYKARSKAEVDEAVRALNARKAAIKNANR